MEEALHQKVQLSSVTRCAGKHFADHSLTRDKKKQRNKPS